MNSVCKLELVTNEAVFTQLMENEIHQMWQQRKQGEFAGVDGVPIRWTSITHPENRACIVVVNGRNETFWKYQELFYELSRQGFDIYALDHRGQGASGRLTPDSELGHVANFDNYVMDLHSFVTDIVQLENYQQRYLLAHSMGGAIATLYLERFNPAFNAAVLNAPMFGIQMPIMVKRVAASLVKFIEQRQTKPRYAMGQKPYVEMPFKQNDQSQSAVRYAWGNCLYQQHPELRLGGVSSRWLWQAVEAANHCVREADKIEVPVLLLQASSDTIVDNQAHYRFMAEAGQCELKVIGEARHELLMEKDAVRNQVLNETILFFSQHT
ncbi:alpha/beta fold hydrolase [Photobacterium makurazakiensis]|uniref:alpha/beta fold hydrolase n=1 Tax=Photobacterium makurazakiensis TaxID=2910234 RepID=UPI003D1359A5